jgi:apolipoprotein D and lipocalin family protein
MGNYLSNKPMKSDLSVVDNVDLTRYIGKWYEIARVPIPFAEPEKSKNVIETYSWNKSDPSVIDVRTDMDVDGKHKVITQKLWSVSSTNSKLKVQFFWPTKLDYWVLELDANYNWAVVGHPNKKYAWILNRQPTMDRGTYETLTDLLERKHGFNVKDLQMTPQDERLDAHAA